MCSNDGLLGGCDCHANSKKKLAGWDWMAGPGGLRECFRMTPGGFLGNATGLLLPQTK